MIPTLPHWAIGWMLGVFFDDKEMLREGADSPGPPQVCGAGTALSFQSRHNIQETWPWGAEGERAASG